MSPDKHGNVLAQEGCTRCACGAKYWEYDVCVSCGSPVPSRCINCTQEVIDPSSPHEPDAWTHLHTLRVPCDPDDLAGQGLDPANGYEACPTPPAED